ncbi:MAG: hypothetical protein OXQ86_03925 [Gammaproteobacteria bacterium]|nr:hypothetical protein [Gammaproteobacteria bacterium]
MDDGASSGTKAAGNDYQFKWRDQPKSIFTLLGDAPVWMALACLMDQTSKRAEVVATFGPSSAGATLF